MKVGKILLLAIFFLAITQFVALDAAFAQNDWARPIQSTVPPSTLYPPRATSGPGNLFGILLSSLQEDLEAIEGVVTEEFGGEELYEEFGETDIHYEDEAPIVGFDSGTAGMGSGCENCGQKSSKACWRCRGGGLIVGGNGASFLRPMWQNNPAFGTGNNTTLATSNSLIGHEFDWSGVLSPHVWLGVQGSSGFGLRGRFWWFDDDQTINYVVPTGNSAFSPQIFGQQREWTQGANIFAQHQIKFQVTDIEFSYAKNHDSWGLEAAGGLRYMDFNQFYVISGTVPGGATTSLSSLHSFKGLGPTVFLKGQHKLGGPLGVFAFGTARGSILFGDGDATVSGPVFQQEFSKAVVSVSEFEVGFPRVFWFRRISSEVELAFVGQLWSGVGNGANAALFASQSDQSMGLMGGRASMGFSF